MTFSFVNFFLAGGGGVEKTNKQTEENRTEQENKQTKVT